MRNLDRSTRIKGSMVSTNSITAEINLKFDSHEFDGFDFLG